MLRISRLIDLTSPSACVVAALAATAFTTTAAIAAAPAAPAESAPAALADVAALESTVRLRPDARLAPGETTVRLRDVAWLHADVASVLGSLPVGELPANAAAADIMPSAVRAAIIAAGGHPARVLVRGGSILVRAGTEQANAGRPVAMTAVRLDASGRATTVAARRRGTDEAGDRPVAETHHRVPAAAALRGEDVMAAATHRLLTRLDVPAEQLRVAIDRNDVSWLRRPMATIHLRLLDPADSAVVRVEIRPRARPMATEPLEGGRIVTLRPERRVERVRVVETIQRGTRLEPGMVDVDTVWVSPRAAALAADADELIGLEIDRTLAAGRPVGRGDVRQPVVVRRGDGIVVRAGSGPMPLEITAIAREDGRIGDRITVRRPGDEMEFPVVILAPGLGRPDTAAAPSPAPAATAGERDRIARR